MNPSLELALRDAVDQLVRVLVEGLQHETQSAAPERLLSVREAAAALGIGRTTVYEEMNAQRLRYLSPSGRRKRLIPQGAITEYIANHVTRPG